MANDNCVETEVRLGASRSHSANLPRRASDCLNGRNDADRGRAWSLGRARVWSTCVTWRTCVMSDPRTPSPTPLVASDPMLALKGLVIRDRYVLERPLGVGAMGVVYEATHQTLRRKFAIKLLRGEHTGNAMFRRRFEREATFTSRLDHPNVVQVVDFGELPSGPLYLVMEYLSGVDLRELLRQELRLPPERARDLMRQILRGISAAHDAGVIHRDIKPANCFLTRTSSGNDLVKVVDFGVARLDDDQGTSALTGVSEVVGSIAYIAPEMVMGQTANVRTDIYALGIVLYEMLAGFPPFKGRDLFELMERHLREAPPALPDTIPASLQQVVARALHKEPGQRFGDAHEMLAALDASASSRSVNEPSVRRPTGAPLTTARLEPSPSRPIVSGEGPLPIAPLPGSMADPNTHRDRMPAPAARPVRRAGSSGLFAAFALFMALVAVSGLLLLARWASQRFGRSAAAVDEATLVPRSVNQ